MIRANRGNFTDMRNATTLKTYCHCPAKVTWFIRDDIHYFIHQQMAIIWGVCRFLISNLVIRTGTGAAIVKNPPVIAVSLGALASDNWDNICVGYWRTATPFALSEYSNNTAEYVRPFVKIRVSTHMIMKSCCLTEFHSFNCRQE